MCTLTFHDNRNLHQLAISTNMIELSYSISEIQTRIFGTFTRIFELRRDINALPLEIQELRHRSQSPEDTLKTTNTIDKALMALDEQLEYIAKSMKTLSDKIQALTTSSNNTLTPESLVLKKRYLAISSDWESVQDESDVLREELKEDKWLTVFRTVTEQADGMMSSLEKAVNRCQVGTFLTTNIHCSLSLGLHLASPSSGTGFIVSFPGGFSFPQPRDISHLARIF